MTEWRGEKGSATEATLEELLTAVTTGGGSMTDNINVTDRPGRFLGRTTVDNFPANQAVTVTNPTANPETGLAKEVTLGQILGKDFATQATLATRASESTLEAVRAILDAHATAGEYQAIEDFYDIECTRSRMFAAGAKAVTSVTTPNASITLTNPVGSPKELIIRRWSMYADANADITYYFNATSTGTLRPAFNMNQHDIVPPPESVAEVRAGTDVISGGTELSVVSRVGPNAPLSATHMCIHLAPGQSWTVRFIGPGATNSVNLNLEWAERTL